MGNLAAIRKSALGNQPAFERYAIYFAPRKGTALAALGERWLGLDSSTGDKQPMPNPWVSAPRRYGFHATLKAPMQLARGVTLPDLLDAVAKLSLILHPVELGTMSPCRLGSFLALMPNRSSYPYIANLAWSCVRSLDHLRAPLTPEDISRRAGLSEAEMQNLLQWGYPYVSDQFRFHMTLTSSLQDEDITRAEKAFLGIAGDALDEPVMVDALRVFGDPGAPETFRLIERFDLTG